MSVIRERLYAHPVLLSNISEIRFMMKKGQIVTQRLYVDTTYVNM